MDKTDRLSLAKRTLVACMGLTTFAVGTYILISAELGVSCWETLSLGMANTLPFLSYGFIVTATSLVILVVDVVMKGEIGIGMLLDSFIVGNVTDLCMRINFLDTPGTLPGRILMLIAGLVVEGIGFCWYMTAALGCGPRDTFVVVMARRLKKLPFGIVQNLVTGIAAIIGIILGGQYGIGTIICIVIFGPWAQFLFDHVFKFDARNTRHMNIIEYFRAWTK